VVVKGLAGSHLPKISWLLSTVQNGGNDVENFQFYLPRAWVKRKRPNTLLIILGMPLPCLQSLSLRDSERLGFRFAI